MSEQLLCRLKLDLNNNNNNNSLHHHHHHEPSTNNNHSTISAADERPNEYDTKGNTKTTHSTTTHSLYESEIIDLKSEDKLVVDGSGHDGGFGKPGYDGNHLLVWIKLIEQVNTLRVSVFMASPTNSRDTVEEVYELENFSSRKPQIFITTVGGKGSNGTPTSNQQHLFGDSTSDYFNNSDSGKDGGDGGNVTVVIEENIKYLLDEQYLKICCGGGNGGEPYFTQSKNGFDNFDVNSIILPPEAPLSTITSQSSVLTFSKLSFVEPPSHSLSSRNYSIKSNNSIWKGVSGRKGRSGIIKYIVVSPQSGDVLEQASYTFNLKVTSFNVKIVSNAPKEISLGHNLILEEDDSDDTSQLDLIDPTDFIEPGCELAITDIEIKNVGGLSAPDNCFIEFEGNDFADVLGFSSCLKVNRSLESTKHILPKLSGGEIFKLSLPLRLMIGKQVKKLDKVSTQSCNLSYFIRKQDDPNTLLLSQGQLCDMPIYYPISFSSFECNSTLGISNDSQRICISVQNKAYDRSISGAVVKLFITNKDVETDAGSSERVFTENIFSIEETGVRQPQDRYNSQLDRIIDPELSVIESVISLSSPYENKHSEKDLSIILEKHITEKVTTYNLVMHLFKNKKISEEILGFKRFNLVVELEYKGIMIDRIIHSITLIPDKVPLSHGSFQSNLGKALMVTDSHHLTSKAYLYYKRLLRSIGFDLYVWDSRQNAKNFREKFSLFKDSLVLVTLFTTSLDSPNLDRIISHFASTNPNESGMIYVTGYPYSLDSTDYRNQLFEHNSKLYSKNFHVIDPKHLTIFYPIEKPSKTLFFEKVNNYLEKKRESSPSLLMRIHKKEFYEDLKYRLPRRIKIGEASLNILPIKSKDRIFCVKFTNSKLPSNNIPEFSPDILTNYHKFSFNSKTFALLFGTIMSSSMQQKVNLLLNRFTEKEWQFCDQKSLDSSNPITIKDVSLFSIYFEITQEIFLKESSLYRFKMLVNCVSNCFINSTTIVESDKEQLLQYVKILLDKLRNESAKIPTQDKTIALKKKEFLKYYTQLRKTLVEKCRSVINNNKKKSISSKRMYKMLGGEALQVKKRYFDDNCRFLLQFVLKPSNDWYEEGSIFRFQKYKWSFERLLVDSDMEEAESQTLPLLF